MRIKIVDRSIDRQLLTAMVVSAYYLRETRDIYDASFFSAKYMQIVAGWCYDYFERYAAAPGRHIQDLYDSAVRGEGRHELQDQELDLIARFLSSISQEYDNAGDLNVEYLLDETEKWWRQQDLKNLVRDVDDALKTADPDEAERLVRQHRRIERAQLDGVDVLRDKEKLKILFEAPQTPLIEFGGAFGEIVNPWMTRDQLIGVLAPPKGGKTALLVECCIRAVAARKNIALFETGDLSEQQTLARIFSNLTGACTDARYAGEHKSPCLDCLKNQDGSCGKRHRPWRGSLRSGLDEAFPDYVPDDYAPCVHCIGKEDFAPVYGLQVRKYKAPYTESQVENARVKTANYMGSKTFRCDTTANSTISVGGIHNKLEHWKNKIGFIPDVIVIDYADILAPEENVRSQDERSKQNERWKRLRRLSQEWHALVLVATQSDAAGFGKETMGFGNFSEDMRKYAHCTGMLAIHQTEYEKERGISRASWILGREGQPGRMTQAVVLSELRVGRYHVDSFHRTRDYRANYEE